MRHRVTRSHYQYRMQVTRRFITRRLTTIAHNRTRDRTPRRPNTGRSTRRRHEASNATATKTNSRHATRHNRPRGHTKQKRNRRSPTGGLASVQIISRIHNLHRRHFIISNQMGRLHHRMRRRHKATSPRRPTRNFMLRRGNRTNRHRGNMSRIASANPRARHGTLGVTTLRNRHSRNSINSTSVRTRQGTRRRTTTGFRRPISFKRFYLRDN